MQCDKPIWIRNENSAHFFLFTEVLKVEDSFGRNRGLLTIFKVYENIHIQADDYPNYGRVLINEEIEKAALLQVIFAEMPSLNCLLSSKHGNQIDGPREDQHNDSKQN